MHNNTPVNASRLLITGLSGFVGKHLRQSLSDNSDWQQRYSLIAPTDFDLLVPESIERMLGNEAPQAVIHLAGQTFVPTAIANPAETLQINLIGTLNLLQALKKKNFSGTFPFSLPERWRKVRFRWNSISPSKCKETVEKGPSALSVLRERTCRTLSSRKYCLRALSRPS